MVNIPINAPDFQFPEGVPSDPATLNAEIEHVFAEVQHRFHGNAFVPDPSSFEAVDIPFAAMDFSPTEGTPTNPAELNAQILEIANEVQRRTR